MLDNLPKLVEIEHQEPNIPDNRNAWILRNLAIGGLKTYEDDDIDTHYFRPASKNLMDMLNNLKEEQRYFDPNDGNVLKRADRVWITGSPGIGKSSTLYGWAMLVGQEKSVLWVHKYGEEFLMIHMNCGVWMGMKSHVISNVLDCMENINANIIIIDGFKKDATMKLLSCAFMSHLKSIIVICTSYGQIRMNTGDEVTYHIKRYKVDSWSYNDYVEAINHRILSSCILENLPIQYYYAGGNMRFFRQNMELVLESINFAIDSSKLDTRTLLQSALGQSNENVVNSLFQSIDGQVSFVSEYVLDEISKKVNFDFVNAAQTVFIGNPSVLGWLFQLEITIRIRLGLLKAIACNGTLIEWKTSNIVDVWDAGDLTTIDLKENTWIIPRKCYQPCIDLIYYRKQGDIEAINVTISNEHDLKLEHLPPFLNRLGIPRVFNTLPIFTSLKFIFIVNYDGSVKVTKINGIETIQQYLPDFNIERDVHTVRYENKGY